MTGPISLSNNIGEIMAPGTLVTALTAVARPSACDTSSPAGIGPARSSSAWDVRLDPGALHGRSELEQRFHFGPKQSVCEASSCWIVWLAIELDAANRPVRYKGASLCELLVNSQTKAAYKSMAEHVNRMSEAMRGEVRVERLPVDIRRAVREQLMAIGSELWQQASETFRAAIDAA